MAYKTREVLLAEIEDLKKTVEQEKRERELHVADIERKCEYEVKDLKMVISSQEKTIADCRTDMKIKDAVLEEVRKFVVDYQQTIRIFAENSSHTIITESDFVDESDIPQS